MISISEAEGPRVNFHSHVKFDIQPPGDSGGSEPDDLGGGGSGGGVVLVVHHGQNLFKGKLTADGGTGGTGDFKGGAGGSGSTLIEQVCNRLSA